MHKDTVQNRSMHLHIISIALQMGKFPLLMRSCWNIIEKSGCHSRNCERLLFMRVFMLRGVRSFSLCNMSRGLLHLLCSTSLFVICGCISYTVTFGILSMYCDFIYGIAGLSTYLQVTSCFDYICCFCITDVQH